MLPCTNKVCWCLYRGPQQLGITRSALPPTPGVVFHWRARESDTMPDSTALRKEIWVLMGYKESARSQGVEAEGMAVAARAWSGLTISSSPVPEVGGDVVGGGAAGLAAPHAIKGTLVLRWSQVQGGATEGGQTESALAMPCSHATGTP